MPKARLAVASIFLTGLTARRRTEKQLCVLLATLTHAASASESNRLCSFSRAHGRTCLGGSRWPLLRAVHASAIRPDLVSRRADAEARGRAPRALGADHSYRKRRVRVTVKGGAQRSHNPSFAEAYLN